MGSVGMEEKDKRLGVAISKRWCGEQWPISDPFVRFWSQQTGRGGAYCLFGTDSFVLGMVAVSSVSKSEMMT